MTERPAAKKKMSALGWVGILVGLLIVGRIAMAISPTQPAKPAPAENINDGKVHTLTPSALSMYGRFLALKDPDSAKFGYGVYRKLGPLTVICGTVNAKNSFGGYAGETGFIISGGSVEMSDRTPNKKWRRDWDFACTNEGGSKLAGRMSRQPSHSS